MWGKNGAAGRATDDNILGRMRISNWLTALFKSFYDRVADVVPNLFHIIQKKKKITSTKVEYPSNIL